MKELSLQYLPTGNIFILPEEVAIEHLNSDRENFKILDKDFKEDKEEVKETTVYEQVVKKPKRKK